MASSGCGGVWAMAEYNYNDDELRELATVVALDAVDDLERARIMRVVESADEAERSVFNAELKAVRATLASISEATAVAPAEELRGRILDEVGRSEPAKPVERTVDEPTAQIDGKPRWARFAAVAAAAAVVLGIGGGVIGYTVANRSEPQQPSQAEQIFAASDVRTTTGTVAGGKASVTYSPTKGEGILVMNDVPSPSPGTIYQMWLVGPDGARLAGTMSPADVAPSTTAVITDMTGATAVAFTVGDAATPEKMIAPPVAELRLG